MASIAINANCMDVMRQYPDKYFDLAVVDPPYGSGGGEFVGETRFGGRFDRYLQDCPDGLPGRQNTEKIVSWDYAPGEDYFRELFRVSKNQIIWGGNYFSLPPNRCFLVWRKVNIPENFSMAMAEYAWCSYNDNAKIISLSSAGIAGRFHPTQKPEDLYRWIYQHYTKPGDKILDTHLGSGSSRRAATTTGWILWAAKSTRTISHDKKKPGQNTPPRPGCFDGHMYKNSALLGN